MIDYSNQLKTKLAEYKGKKIYLYGAKNMGGVAYKLLKHYGINVVAYITTAETGSLNGIPILKVSELNPKDSENAIVILTLNDVYHSDVKPLLIKKGFTHIDDSFTVSQIYFFSEIFKEIFLKNHIDITKAVLTIGDYNILNPYMNKEISSFWLECGDLLLPALFNNFDFLCEGPYEISEVKLEKNDIVFDCGANIGLFSAYAASKGATSYAFEPLECQLGEILHKHEELSRNRILPAPYALSDYKGEAEFNVSDELIGSSSLTENSTENKDKVFEETIKVKVTTIDDFVEENKLEKVDFIKADIEGAERQMLKGAVKTLKKFAPKLAICTYHYPDDPIVLEKIIKDANPDYNVIHKWKKLFAYVNK